MGKARKNNLFLCTIKLMISLILFCVLPTIVDAAPVLTNLDIIDYNDDLNPSFASNVYEYNIRLYNNAIDLNINATSEPGSTINIINNKYIKDNSGTVYIDVTDGTETTRYTIHYIKNKVLESSGRIFSYTGNYQTFTVPETTTYKIQLWGGYGFGTGYGAYTEGKIKLTKGTNLYVYVGNKGTTGMNQTTFNNGTGNQGGYNGGGATDVRLTAGSWDNFDSVKSRIMVAGAGGSGSGVMGAGGGLLGYSGGGTTGGSQTAPGGRQHTSYTLSYFGRALGGCTGGNGYYPGGGATCANGAGGGSSYISGHQGVNSISEDSTSYTNIIHTGEAGHYSGYRFYDTVMIDGKGYEWTTEKSNNVVGMPNFTNTGTMTGNSSTGYAIITQLLPPANNNYLSSITTSTGTWDKEFNPIISDYKINIDTYTNFVTLEGIADDSEAVVLGNGTFELQPGDNHKKILVISDSGETRVYNINLFREGLKGKHSSEIRKIEIDGYETIYTEKNNYTYDIQLRHNTIELKINAILYDEEASYTVEGNELILDTSGSIKIKVTEPNTVSKTYTINYQKEIANPDLKAEYTYLYTGNYQEFIAPATGEYRIELYGGAGTGAAYGGYTAGTINLSKDQELFVYVGRNSNIVSNAYAFNNGQGTASGYTGGGATDIRIVEGAWNNFESLKSRIMVAAGGGSATTGTPGAAGGLKGYDGLGSYGGSQTKIGAWTSRDSSTGYPVSYFGIANGGTTGGNGYYPGSGASFVNGSGGGSSFISGHEGCDAISSSSETITSIKHTGQPIHYSGMYFYDTKMIDGKGYEWTNEKGNYVGMPKTDNSGVMTGNTGNGLAKITLLDAYSKNNYLKDLNFNKGTISPEFSPIKTSYIIDVDMYTHTIDLEGIPFEETEKIVGNGTYELELGDNIINIYVTSQSGDTKIYEINVRRKTLEEGYHTSELQKIEIKNFDTIYFEKDVYEYDLTINYATISLSVTPYAYDEEAIVKLSGFGYIKKSGTAIITVTEPNSEPTVYKINIIKEGAPTETEFEYNYTGNYQTFEATATGYYKVELWGGYGFGTGYGGYTSGTIKLEKGELLYVYVGNKGTTGNNKTTFNNGTGNQGGYNGGGATDIRLIAGNWDNFDSLKSRIMVAGAGGSGSGTMGAGGGLVGYSGRGTAGGTQNNAGGRQHTSYTLSYFGRALGGCTGGNGYYPGGGATCVYGAGGGSSYISGHEGVDSISATSTENNIIHTGESTHYSGVYFTNTVMIDGLGYEWTDSRQEKMAMPSPTGGYFPVGQGNNSNGYAKITLLTLNENNFLSNLIVKYEDKEKNYLPTFDMENNDYTLDLSSNETEITISAKPEDSSATINGLGLYQIPAGTTVIPIEVTAENGDIRIYNLTVNRPADTNPYPDDIIINGLVPSLCSFSEEYCKIKNDSGYIVEFDKNTHTYYLTVPSRIKQLYFDVSKGHPNQVINGEGKVTLNGWDNNFTVTIMSEASLKKEESNLTEGVDYTTYNFVVTRDMTGNTDLNKLDIIDPLRDINFTNEITDYYLSIPNSYEKIEEMDIETDDPNASFTIVGNENLQTGMNEIYIIVTAQNGETKTYILNVYREKNSNVYLQEIKVEDISGKTYPITPEYNKIYVGPYNATVPNDITEVNILATAEINTTSISGTGLKQLKTGNNQFTIITTAEDGETEIYKVNIYREKNNNTNLTSLLIKDNLNNELELNPSFEKEIFDYETTVEEGITSVSISAATEESTTKYQLLDNANIRVGKNIKRVSAIAEDGSTKIYTITITRPASSDNLLSELTIKNTQTDEMYDIGFDPIINSYTLMVSNDVKQLTVNSVRNNILSTISGNGKYSLSVGENKINIAVKSESGITNIYEIVVVRKPNSNAYLKTITTSEGIIVPDFNKEEKKYIVNIENNVTSFSVSAVAEVGTTTINGGYNNETIVIDDIPSGSTEIQLVTLAEDGVTSLTYIIEVIKDKSDNDNLSYLLMEEGAISPTFNPDIIQYYVDVPYEVTKGTFHIELEDSKASYVIKNNNNFVVGENEVIIEVTSESLLTKEYKVIVNRQNQESNSSYLQNLSVDNGKITPIFNKYTQYYEVEVPYTINKILLTGNTEDISSNVSGLGTYTLNVGKNLAIIKVTSADGSIRNYQVVITRQKNNDARLSSLSINGSIINPTFDKDIYEYTVSTSDSTLSFSKITTYDPNATYEIINNNLKLNQDNKVIIRVTAEDGITTKDYIINVNKSASNNNNLKSLEILGFEYTPKFNKITTLYNLTVDNDIKNITIEALPEDENATITSGLGNHDLKVGENQIVVEVTSESGKVKAYVIVVNKLGSNDAKADSIVVNNGIMSPTFTKENNTYNVSIPYNEDSLDLIVSLSNENATYEIKDNDLKDKQSGVVKIIVTAEDGTINTYILNVVKDNVISSLLKDIKIKNYQLSNPFNSNVINYDVIVDNEVTSLNLTPITLDPDATFIINGNNNFNIGNNEVEIVVTSSDGNSTTTYTLNVIRQSYSNSYLDYLYTDQGDLTPTFNKEVMEYTITVDNKVNTIELFGEAIDKSATVTGLGVHNLKVGNNEIKVTVKTISGITRTYIINVLKEKSDENYLETLSLKSGNEVLYLTPSFNKNTNNYEINVPSSVLSIKLEGNISNNATVTGLGSRKLETGENIIEITVTSESGIPNVYRIVVNKEASTNNMLIELTPNVGVLEPSFTYGEKEYELNLDSSASVLFFVVSTEDGTAKVTGIDSQVIPDGESTREIIVTSESGVSSIYTIHVNKQRADNALLSLLKVNGYDFEEEFDPNVFEYHLKVPNSKKILTASEIITKTQDINARVNKTSSINLSTKDYNEYTITVTAQDGFTKQDYKIIIDRELGSESTITSLKPLIGYLEENFNENKLEYTWIVPKSTTKLSINNINYVLKDPNSNVEVVDELILSESKEFEIKVISEDGTSTTTYTLNIVYDLSADGRLESLTIDKGYYQPEFDPDTYTYEVYEYEDTDSINISVTLINENSEVLSGVGELELTSDLTVHEIVVYAEDGSTEIYVLNIHKMIKKDEGLNNLFLNGLDINNPDEEEKLCIDNKCILNPTFNNDVISYDIKVPYEYEDLDVYYETMNDQQSIKIKVNNEYVDDYKLELGKNKVQVEVYDGMGILTRTYTLNIERVKSNNTYLQKLTIDNGLDLTDPNYTQYELDKEFDKHIQEYTIYVGKDVDEVNINAVPEFEKSGKTINGYNYLVDGENDATIDVIAPDGSIRTYIVHIIKSANYNSLIKNITVSTGVFWDLTPKFKSTTYEYTTTVESTYNKATVEAVPVLPSTIITGTGEYDLITGTNTIILTSISSEDGSVSVYTINIIKKASTNVNLSSLVIEEGDLLPSFEKGTTKYEIIIDDYIDNLTIHAIPEDKSSTIIITGNENLITGANTINIVVQSEDKSSSKTYQIIANKKPSNNALLENLTVKDNAKQFDFDPLFTSDIDTYDVTVNTDTEKVLIEAIAQNKYANITGIGEEYLNYGNNEKTITITSESGNIKVYTINIYRPYNLYLSTLVSDVGTLTPTFDKLINEYTINVPNEIDEITFVALAESNKATVTGSGTYNLTTGENVLEFIVKGPDDTQNIYKVIINRDKDSNNYIKELNVDGILTPTFEKTTTDYIVDIRKNYTSLNNLNYVLESDTASAEIIGNKDFTQTKNPNIVIIRVTAEDGSIRDYTLNVMLRDDDFFSNRLVSLKIDNGSLTPDFAPDINNYAVTVSNSVSELNINAIPENERAIVTGDGKVSLNVGRNVIPIIVQAQDGSVNEYDLIVYRSEANDATLQSLSVTGQNFIPIFNKLTENYEMEIGSEIDELEVIAVPTDSGATVKISGNKNLVSGENTIKILVTAPDKITTKTYTIKVTKSISKNNYLSDLNITDYNISPNFIKTNQGPYTINVPSTVNSINITANPEAKTSTVTGDGIVKLTGGKNVITVKVTAESGDTRDYTVIVNKALSSDSTLKDILLSDESLDPVFNPNNHEYTVTVPEELESITITGIVNDLNATVKGNGNYNIIDDFTVDIIVTAEDGNTTTYKVNVVRDIPASSLLKSLIVKDGELYPGFHKLITSYTILVPNEIRSLNMTYTPEDEKATVTVTGNENFKVGTNKVHIIVTAIDGTQTDYEIAVVRQSMSSNYLKSLSVDGYTLNPEFNKNNMYYEVTVPEDIDMVKIKATPEDSTSTITGTGYVSLKVGTNRMYVTVESASGYIRSYQIVINRTASSENYLLTLESDVGELNPTFDKDVYNYTIEVPDKTDIIKLSGTVSPNSTVNGLGTYNVELGTTTRTITVTSQSGEINTYTINIVRNSANNTELIDLIPSNGILSPEYTNDVTTYTLEVSDNVNVISFQATPVDKDAIVTTDDIMVLNYGENTYHVKVVAEDRITERNIAIKIVRNKELAQIKALTSKVFLDIDETENVTYELIPSDTSYTEVEWVSKDNNIATVDNNGNIRGINYGSTTIQIVSKHDPSIYYSIVVNVMSKKIISSTYDIYRNDKDTPEEDKTLEYIIGLEAKVTAKDFISKLDNEPTMIKVTDSNGIQTDGDIVIGTGFKVQLVYDETLLDELTIIVRGDLTGDGQINNTDYVKLKNYILKKTTFNEIEMKAGDLTQSNTIVTTDYVKMKNYILKKINSVN